MFKVIDNMSLENLSSMRSMMFLIVLADVFGIYWYLELKRLGIALLIVSMVFLSIILIAERRKMVKKMDEQEEKLFEKKEKPDDKPKKDKKEDDDDEEPEGMNFGLPDAKEYNKRLEKAIGM